jgi:hypothetical protein
LQNLKSNFVDKSSQERRITSADFSFMVQLAVLKYAGVSALYALEDGFIGEVNCDEKIICKAWFYRFSGKFDIHVSPRFYEGRRKRACQHGTW